MSESRVKPVGAGYARRAKQAEAKQRKANDLMRQFSLSAYDSLKADRDECLTLLRKAKRLLDKYTDNDDYRDIEAYLLRVGDAAQ